MPGSTTTSKKKILFIAAIAASAALIYVAIPKGEAPQHIEKSSSSLNGIAPQDFHGIPPEGIGGDPNLNRLKNRWVAPLEIREMTVSQIIALAQDQLMAMGKENRSKWTSAAIKQASANEDQGVQVIGYLAHAKESGPEACNGKSDTYHDFHIWITSSPSENKNNGIIVEATPFWKERFPAWQLGAFEKLASEHAKVRISGWLLWDQEHGDEVGKSRGSLWEVHPFTKFEVYSDAKWEELKMGIAYNLFRVSELSSPR